MDTEDILEALDRERKALKGYRIVRAVWVISLVMLPVVLFSSIVLGILFGPIMGAPLGVLTGLMFFYLIGATAALYSGSNLHRDSINGKAAPTNTTDVIYVEWKIKQYERALREAS